MKSKSSTITKKVRPHLNLPPIHPGEMLAEEMHELDISANAFARALGVPANRVTEILNGRRSISADTALRLSRYFGTSPKLWLNLQQSYDLAVAERENGKSIARTVKPHAA